MPHLSNGTQVFIEGSRGEEIAVTAISNAAKPVFTVASAAGLAAGDYIVVTSASSTLLAEKQLRITAITGNAVTVEGIDTTSTTKFPAGGTAEIAKVLTWFEVPCVQEVSTDGGEQQFVNFQCLSDDREQQIPTYKSAVTNTFTFAHEYTNPVYPVLRNYDETGQLVAIRLYVPKASEMRMQTGTVAFNDTPTIGVNEIETVSIAISIRGKLSSVSSNFNPAPPIPRLTLATGWPADLSVADGGVLNLPAIVVEGGEAPYTYEYTNPESEAIPSFTGPGPSLVTSTASAANSGTYTVKVTSSDGQVVEDAIVVTVA